MKNNSSESSQPTPFTRRRFLATTGASALSFALAQPAILRAADGDTKLNIGLIGCGGRGTWITDLFLKDGRYNLVGLADYFPDKVKLAGEKFNVDESRRFTGLSAYKRLLEQKLDAVVIESPPYFHAEQAAAAIDAGKHVYCAKPIAVDVPGCQTVAETGRKATGKKLVFLVDFQTRAHPSYQQAVSLVQKGGIGRIVSAEANYQDKGRWAKQDEMIRSNPHDNEVLLRSWAADRTLSGDIITEQNIHSIDMASWVLNAEPLRAWGTGGRLRQPVHNGVWDNFSVIFDYPNDVRLTFDSKQYGKFGDDISCHAYGLEGALDMHYGGVVKVMCDDAFNGGIVSNIYSDGVVRNIASFYQAITTGDVSNATVAPSVRSTLVTILGRTAAYRRAEVTWAHMIKANEKWEARLKGLKA